MKDIAQEMGVRTGVPFRELTAEERDIVFHGPAVKKNIIYQNKTSGAVGGMDFTYFNATYTVENALSKVKDEKGMKRVEKFLKQGICPDCGGTRLSQAARAPKLRGISLDRAASTLSTGERQRMQLARAVRNRTTGVLYVLDEPSIGLHPSNIVGLTGVMHDLVTDGNSVLLVDYDTQILSEADWLIEMGPEAGANGGQVVAQGTIPEFARNPASQIGSFLAGTADVHVRERVEPNQLFELGTIRLSTGAIHTVKPLEADIPKGRLTVVTGVSGSGKTTLILESLVPGLTAAVGKAKLPEHVRAVEAEGIQQIKLIDATPIGINVRSTVATYAGIHDELRKIFARPPRRETSGLQGWGLLL